MRFHRTLSREWHHRAPCRPKVCALTLYPGAVVAFDRAIAADPDFALAHAGKAQVLLREGNVLAAREAVAAGVTAREASHIAFCALVFAGRTDAAISALDAHLSDWPRDALVVASATSTAQILAVLVADIAHAERRGDIQRSQRSSPGAIHAGGHDCQAGLSAQAPGDQAMSAITSRQSGRHSSVQR